MHWEIIRQAIQYTNLIQNVPTDSSRPSFFSFVYRCDKRQLWCWSLCFTVCTVTLAWLSISKYKCANTILVLYKCKYKCTNTVCTVLLAWLSISRLWICKCQSCSHSVSDQKHLSCSLSTSAFLWNQFISFEMKFTTFFSNYVATSSPVVAFDKEQSSLKHPFAPLSSAPRSAVNVGFNL